MLPANLLLLHGLGVNEALSWNPPSWSISVELYLYGAFAIFVGLPRQFKPWAAAAVVVASLAVVAALSPEYMNTTFAYGFPRGCAGFFTGYLVYRLQERWRPQIGSAHELAATVCVILFVSLAADNPASLAAPLVFGVAIFIFAREAGAASRRLVGRAGLALGAWSYSIYMVHYLVMVVMSQVATRVGLAATEDPATGEQVILFPQRWALDVMALLYVAIVIAIASVTYRAVEVPAQKWFKKVSQPRAVASIA